MSEALLAVEGLNAYYGGAHVVQDVSFELGEQALAIVGRNGMG
jgi:branched-chain amino acid transport system ATP-binding protein